MELLAMVGNDSLATANANIAMYSPTAPWPSYATECATALGRKTPVDYAVELIKLASFVDAVYVAGTPKKQDVFIVCSEVSDEAISHIAGIESDIMDMLVSLSRGVVSEMQTLDFHVVPVSEDMTSAHYQKIFDRKGNLNPPHANEPRPSSEGAK